MKLFNEIVMQLCRSDSLTLIQLLVKCGIKLEKIKFNNGNTIFHELIRPSNKKLPIKIINYIIDNDLFLINEQNENNSNILNHITFRNDFPIDLFKKLIKKGIDIHNKDKSGYYPLLNSTLIGNLTFMDILLEYKANPLVKGPNEFDCLHIACIHGNFKSFQRIIEWLNQNQQPIELEIKDKQISLLMLCCNMKNNSLKSYKIPFHNSYNNYDQNTRIEIVSILLKQKHNINKIIYPYPGENALTIACKNIFLKAVGTLIENKAEINVRETLGDTPLMIAAEKGHLEMVKLLIKSGADPNLDSSVMFPLTAMSYAKLRKHHEVEKYLMTITTSAN